MAASSTWNLHSVSNIILLSARCTGFAKTQGQNNFTFILDLEWSDERAMSIKRTFEDFRLFHNNLVKLFPELKDVNGSRPTLGSGLKENVTSLFAKDKRELAESREAMLDLYLRSLLRQPERIRRSNIVLSFFESRPTDPKPVKTNSPSEKSDSGIDLTADKPRPMANLKHDVGIQYQSCVDPMITSTTDIDYLNQNCDVGTTSKPAPSCSELYTRRSESPDEDYREDSSETETDESFDEDYFLDVGFGDLMLHKHSDFDDHQPISPASSDASMWCSNMDKFSNILKSSIVSLPTDDIAAHQYTRISSLSEALRSDDDAFLRRADSYLNEPEVDEQRESSETESQMVGEEQVDGLQSDEELSNKSIVLSNMRHYYLSTTDISTTE